MKAGSGSLMHLAFLAVLMGCAHSRPAPIETVPSTHGPFTLVPLRHTTLDLELYGRPDSTQRVIRSVSEWVIFWSSLTRREPVRRPLPEIDFEKYDLLYLTCGSRPSGWGVTSVIAQTDSQMVHITIYVPSQTPKCALAISGMSALPAYFALLPKTSLPLAFTYREDARECPR